MALDRPQLATLLARLQSPGASARDRLAAAQAAAHLALETGDPSLADVAESLAVEDGSDDAERAHLRGLARAARRAIALSRRSGAPSPQALARALADDAAGVASAARGALGAGRPDLARQIAALGLARHPGDASLHAILADARA
jgi:hypothetical protein